MVRRGVILSPAVHLKRFRTESAHDEGSITVCRAVEKTLLGCSQVIAGDDNAVRVRMTVQVHVLWLSERRFYRVVAGRFVCRIPICYRRTSGEAQHIAF